MKIVFAADPMCSWCYGFAKELDDALAQLPQVPFEIRMAGLWADGRQPLNAEAKAFRLSHWSRVEAAAGVPFNREAFLARQNFLYNSEPISRAFVAGVHLAPTASAIRLLRNLQQAFYVEGLDTTDVDVLGTALARALRDQGLPHAAVHARPALDFDLVHHIVRHDFLQVRDWGLTSFPKLLKVGQGTPEVLLAGFANTPEIVEVMARAMH